ncbi:unnamed protein product [Linum trigynum]|uniref:Uncharacterized protein n=1 Tax=Linum trigynum TaxID=586398 RepID=A0AAV2CX98_9ROSI
MSSSRLSDLEWTCVKYQLDTILAEQDQEALEHATRRRAVATPSTNHVEVPATAMKKMMVDGGTRKTLAAASGTRESRPELRMDEAPELQLFASTCDRLEALIQQARDRQTQEERRWKENMEEFMRPLDSSRRTKSPTTIVVTSPPPSRTEEIAEADGEALVESNGVEGAADLMQSQVQEK